LSDNPKREIIKEEADSFAGPIKYVSLGVEAKSVTSDLRWATFRLTCEIGTKEHPKIGVSYVFNDDAMEIFEHSVAQEGAFVTYGNGYSFDLLASTNSGRPAAYDLGDGFVRNDDYDEGSAFSERPIEYFERMDEFFEVFLTLSDADTFEVRFVTTGRNSDRMDGNYFAIVFPMRGFSLVSEEFEECLNEYKN
jgi:hypothetical protein